MKFNKFKFNKSMKYVIVTKRHETHRPVVDGAQTFSVPELSFCNARLLKPRPILS